MKSSPDPIIIIGAGLAGLATALESMSRGFPVVILEKREENLRPQVILFKMADFKYLTALYDRMESKCSSQERIVFDKVAPYFAGKTMEVLVETTISIKDLERFLWCCIEITNRENNGELLEKYRNDDLTISEIKPQSSTVFFECPKEDGTVIGHGKKFSHLVIAEGTKRETIKQFSEENQKYKIIYKDQPTQLEHPYHATVTLKTISGDPKKPQPQPQDSAQKKAFSDSLAALGWDKTDRLPNIYIFPNRQLTKFYMATEIPEAIYHEADPEIKTKKIVEWGKAIAKAYSLDPDDLMLSIPNSTAAMQKREQKNWAYQKKDQLKAQSFETQAPHGFQYTEQAVTRLHNGTSIFIMGDALRDPVYQGATGGGNALSDARQFGECLPDNITDIVKEFDYETYEEAIHAGIKGMFENLKGLVGRQRKHEAPSEQPIGATLPVNEVVMDPQLKKEILTHAQKLTDIIARVIRKVPQLAEPGQRIINQLQEGMDVLSQQEDPSLLHHTIGLLHEWAIERPAGPVSHELRNAFVIVDQAAIAHQQVIKLDRILALGKKIVEKSKLEGGSVSVLDPSLLFASISDRKKDQIAGATEKAKETLDGHFKMSQ